MPLRVFDPFHDPTERLNPEINPYMERLVNGCRDGSLRAFYGPSLEGMAGQWRQRLGIAGPVIVEIGCHMGHTLLAMAEHHPDKLFVGLDITFKRVVETALKAEQRGRGNVACALANARGLPRLFAPGEVDGAVVFFPDPWPKKKHAKNRLLSPEFAAELRGILAPGGFVWLKTDADFYFEQASAALEASGFTLVTCPDGLAGESYGSLFEERFRRRQMPIYGGVWANTRKS